MTGPSGSGKTTLLTLVGELRSPQEGSLKILGKELFGAAAKDFVLLRRNIGYIFQAHNLLACLTARQNVQMSLELHPEIQENLREKTAEILTAVGLEDELDYYLIIPKTCREGKNNE